MRYKIKNNVLHVLRTWTDEDSGARFTAVWHFPVYCENVAYDLTQIREPRYLRVH